MSHIRKAIVMRIAYLTQLHPSSDRGEISLPPHMTEALAKRKHRVLVISASNQDHTQYFTKA